MDLESTPVVVRAVVLSVAPLRREMAAVSMQQDCMACKHPIESQPAMSSGG